MKERVILIIFTLFGICATAFSFRKPPYKELVIVYLLKATISSFTDQMVVNRRYLSYPIRYFPKTFKTAILFDYLLFPWACVLYYQVTRNYGFKDWISKVILFIIPLSVTELIILKKTKLLKFKKWNILMTVISEMVICILIRGFMGLLKRVDRDEVMDR